MIHLRVPALCLLLLASASRPDAQTVIRINQLGYTPASRKCAVYAAVPAGRAPDSFCVCDALTDSVVWRSRRLDACGAWGPFSIACRLDFTSCRYRGGVYLLAGGVRSPVFPIGDRVYDGAADFILRYIRAQQCGYNPLLADSCHTRDGFLTGDSLREGEHADVTGGWHDASDYLRYAATSATTAFQLLFAWRRTPEAFGDAFDGRGDPVPNGVPDVLDAARWGIDWLRKMNPSPGLMFNQVADDRDHLGFRLPDRDTVTYGRGAERPVYVCTGRPQGYPPYLNRSTGLASTAGKFASAFAMGAICFRGTDTALSRLLAGKARAAYALGREHPGVCQTAPRRAPYFYEEEDWTDDMELAAAALGDLTHDTAFAGAALGYAADEPVSPWMTSDTARHYQWYPFVNLGHALIAGSGTHESMSRAARWYREGLLALRAKAEGSPFRVGTPMIWCSSNYVAAALLQSLLYREMTGDTAFADMEAGLRDWLFGCNPWGAGLVIGLPSWGITPRDPHSAFSHAAALLPLGGLVDGPVRASIFGSLRGVHLSRGDVFAPFQSPGGVYHDDWADYATNEPTLDGSAELVPTLAALASPAGLRRRWTFSAGGVTRFDSLDRRVYLAFTGDAYAGEAFVILDALKRHGARASFFFTGRFYRTAEFAPIIRRIRSAGHYLGAHSDTHLLYAPWDAPDSLLVGKEEFLADLQANYRAMGAFGIRPADAPWFVPPFEFYNRTIAAWARMAGLDILTFTPGTWSNADYTTPEMGAAYVPSDSIVARILRKEAASPAGLNGCILLMHIGTGEARTDKFARRLDALLEELTRRGYAPALPAGGGG